MPHVFEKVSTGEATSRKSFGQPSTEDKKKIDEFNRDVEMIGRGTGDGHRNVEKKRK